MFLLIPFTRFTLKTYLSAYEAEKRLVAHVEPRKVPWSLSRNHKLFAGKIENGKFKITRIIHFRNSFLAITTGQIHNDQNTNRIEITMRSSYFSMGLMALFDFALTFYFIGILIELLFEIGTYGGGINALVTSLGILIFFHGGNMAFFNYEANKTRRYLEEIFEVNNSI
jgi:hypothetical protein